MTTTTDQRAHTHRHALAEAAAGQPDDAGHDHRPGNERAWKCPGCGRTYCVCSRRRNRTRRPAGR